jgi:hypothetical protein
MGRFISVALFFWAVVLIVRCGRMPQWDLFLFSPIVGG